MNYEKLYYGICLKAKFEKREKFKGVYYELHHIQPRSMNGDDSKENLVLLTGREHIICHYLLMKIVKEEPYRTKLIFALNAMQNQNAPNQQRYQLKSKLYEKIKKESSAIQSKNILKYLKDKEHPMAGYKWSEEQLKSKSEKMKLVKFTEERNQMISMSLKNFYKDNEVWNKGCKSSQETKDKISKGLMKFYEANPSALLGRKHTEETKIKLKNRVLVDHGAKTLAGMSEGAYKEIHKKVECEVCHKWISRQNYKQFHGIECGIKKPQIRVSCVYCKKDCTPSTLSRFHSNNCKEYK